MRLLVLLAVSMTLLGALCPLARSQAIALYGAQNVTSFGSSAKIYNSAGVVQNEMLFQNAAGSGSSGINLNIEDVAYDGSGNLYAVGKPNASGVRTVFKSTTGYGNMDILFQNTFDNYNSAIDGSLTVSRTGQIAVYGAQNTTGFGSSVRIYDQSGAMQNEMLFQNAPGSGSSGINLNIEDIVFDPAGNLYAVGKPNATGVRTVFKSTPGYGNMDILFENTFDTYNAEIDGSLSVAPNGKIALYGAQNVTGFGSSVRIYDQLGAIQNEMLFQNAVGSGSSGINLNVEDLAFDSDGNLFAVGKPNAGNARTVFMSTPGYGNMEILFENFEAFNAEIDGSIAVYGASAPVAEPAALGILSALALTWRRWKR